MILTDDKTGLTYETLTNGFLGYPIIHIIWKGNQMIAYSLDKINWKITTWFLRFPLTNNKT